jgi:hypothetical protein
VGGVEVGVQAGRQPDPVEHVGVPRRDRLVVAGQDQVPDRIAEREVGLTVGVGEAFLFREEASLDEEASDLLGGGFEVRPLGVVDVQVDEPLEELEVSRRRGRVPVGREVEVAMSLRVYTVEIG